MLWFFSQNRTIFLSSSSVQNCLVLLSGLPPLLGLVAMPCCGLAGEAEEEAAAFCGVVFAGAACLCSTGDSNGLRGYVMDEGRGRREAVIAGAESSESVIASTSNIAMVVHTRKCHVVHAKGKHGPETKPEDQREVAECAQEASIDITIGATTHPIDAGAWIENVEPQR